MPHQLLTIPPHQIKKIKLKLVILKLVIKKFGEITLYHLKLCIGLHFAP